MPNIRVMRTLGWFVALSLAVHLWFIYGVPFELPRYEPAPRVLEARLQPAPPLPPVVPRAKPAPPRKSAAHQSAPAPAPDAAPASTSALQFPREAAVSDAIEPPPAPAPVPVPVVAEVKPAPPLTRRLPRQGEITYVLYLGNDKFNVGRTRQSWQIDGDSYRLASVSETSGLAALFVRQRLAYASRGRLTARGLQPEHFTTERVRSGKSENAATDFDWGTASAMVGNPPRRVALPADAQDIVSFMYQLGLVPLTPGRIELPITNGWKLERYELEIGIEEMLETPFGVLRAVPVRQVRRAEQETVELWLAPAYRWLPVRIRFLNREGEPAGEQVVAEIRVSED